ncbi:MAG: hypothetical protein KAU14_02505 [Thermoplasmata archaeon]|nr:hypothetical protein [Thermoplasmata archaeon]
MEIRTKEVLKRIVDLEREVGYIKRDLLHIEEKPAKRPSLFGSVYGGDIPEEITEKAKKDLFRDLGNV